ncbi:hypothetical protein [Glaciecola sp. KUL10]|uniref:hypothetical protein n=1 Tax=Glaciecola sp. (strain KUL10) TaxID=2161813 RepID=UPI000D7843D6|nr:hypothetical protein [Glaciecola sp. KUL10]GBL05211.1 hypothetical protein KUL10_25310 [Glaciecola sp. KUL10]
MRATLLSKSLLIVFLLQLLSACNLLEQNKVPAPVVSAGELCESELTSIEFGDFCQVNHWHNELIEYSEISWPERNTKIKSLSDKPVDLLQKVLLSHGNDTPYASRLRAQSWISTLQTLSDKTMTQLLDILFYQANQQLLELESAITILSRVNSRQSKAIENQEALLAEKENIINTQQRQVEQLLNIEASLVNKEREEQ